MSKKAIHPSLAMLIPGLVLGICFHVHAQQTIDEKSKATSANKVKSLSDQGSPSDPTSASLGGFQFSSFVQYNTGTYSTGIDSGDLDGDGDIDLAISNRDTNDVSILLNNGEGTFAPALSYPVGTEPRYVVIADFDGDCHLDLATVDRAGDQVSVLLNDGNAVFMMQAQIPLLRPTWLIPADIDGDGDQDILVTEWDDQAAVPSTSPGLLSVLLNDGSANFTKTTSRFVGITPRGGDVADLDGNGTLDIIINNLDSASMSIIFVGVGGVLGEAVTVSTGPQPRYVTAGKFDADDYIDVGVVHKFDDSLWIFTNDGAGNLSITPGDKYVVLNNPHAVTNADLDGDGDQDIIVSHVADTRIAVMDNDGLGNFTLSSIFSSSGAPHVIAADLQQDGDLDLATANTNGSARVHLNQTLQLGPPACPGDIDESGFVTVTDLIGLLAAWGPCCSSDPAGCPADQNRDGGVNVTDLLVMLGAWGACP